MPATKKKPSTSKGLERIRTAEIGPDGKTVGQRLREAMLAHDPPYDPSRDQSRLARDCQRIYAAAYEDVGKPVPAVIQQQNIGELLRDKQSKSKYIPIIASVLGVESTWLLLGIGPRDADIHKIRNLASQIMNSLDRDSKPRK